MFDDDGHIKLTDFGLSLDKKNSKEEGSKRIVGTPDYMTPEIFLKGAATTKSLDWWSLGVLIYEMLLGARPFNGENVEEVYDNILKGDLEWPEVGYGEGMVSPEAKNLIEQLLVNDPEKRLGVNGVSEIKAHSFFKNVKWETIKNEQLTFKPASEVVMFE